MISAHDYRRFFLCFWRVYTWEKWTVLHTSTAEAPEVDISRMVGQWDWIVEQWEQKLQVERSEKHNRDIFNIINIIYIYALRIIVSQVHHNIPNKMQFLDRLVYDYRLPAQRCLCDCEAHTWVSWWKVLEAAATWGTSPWEELRPPDPLHWEVQSPAPLWSTNTWWLVTHHSWCHDPLTTFKTHCHFIPVLIGCFRPASEAEGGAQQKHL